VTGSPPVFNAIGSERKLNSEIFVVEGNDIEFNVTAVDPDGDPLIYSAQNVPSWADFDNVTRKFNGTAPLWSIDNATRKNQQGIFDVTFSVTDGIYSVSKIVSIIVLDSLWVNKTVAELVADRPILAGGNFSTPVQIGNLINSTISTTFGGGKNLHLVNFSFTSQVPNVTGWENDWNSSINLAYLPIGNPAVDNVGAVVEGTYSGTWGQAHLAERVCAELDIPVLVINCNWSGGYPGELMSRYNDKAIETRDLEYLWYTFSTAHYIRAADALVTVINNVTDWSFSYENFSVVFTGHSKFGVTCFTAAATDPNRVVGFMSSGVGNIDSGATRLLGELQGASSTKPDSMPNYLGTMMRYYVEPLDIISQMNSSTQILITEGSDDNKNVTDGYDPKYQITVAEEEITIEHRVEYIPNLEHTTQSTQHSKCWRMWLAHIFLGVQVGDVDSLTHNIGDVNITIKANVSVSPSVKSVTVWATDQNDYDISSWNGFKNYTMTLIGSYYIGEIPKNSTAYFVEILDQVGTVEVLISSTPMPVNESYPLLGFLFE